MDLTGIYRRFHPITLEYTWFSLTHETFSGIEHTWGDKSSFSLFIKIEIMPLSSLATKGKKKTVGQQE